MSKPNIEIIYQDDRILVINKPSGISVTKDRSGEEELKDVLPYSDLQLIHRLDKDTSGVMILAKTPEAQTQFSGYFENRQVKKTYLAIVAGIPPAVCGTVKTLIRPQKKNSALMKISIREGKEAVTDWRILADFGEFALLAVNPVTGRTHQIRVHLPSIGMPMLIDPLYGNDQPFMLSSFKMGYKFSKYHDENPLISRLTLHAYQIELPAIPDCFIAKPDKKFLATIKMLAKYNSAGYEAFTNRSDLDKIANGIKL